MAAWRCGLAHYRAGALALVPLLPERVAAAALQLSEGVSPEPQALLQALRDPWRPPSSFGGAWRPRGLALVARAGGFRGFGGPFVSPPEVFLQGGTLFAFDAEFCWSLHADGFGVTFKRHGPELPKGNPEKGGAFTIDPQGQARKGVLSGEFPVLKNSTSAASNEDTLAVTVPRSHRIYLVAAVG